MIRKNLLFTAAAVMAMLTQATAQSEQGHKAIKDLCGCFAVTFNYAETFTNDTVNKKTAHPIDTFSVLEYEYPIEETDKKIVIQHLLVVPGGTIIKHWREDWEFEKRELWQYEKDKEWVKTQLPQDEVKGKWMQSVWEVSDAPRYQGISDWVYTNHQLFWLNTTDAPLPRREYTTRHDYNVMNRTNRLIVTDNGYMHEQDNKKIIRRDGYADSILAYEKGYNQYVRMPESKCAAAKAFWTTAKSGFWSDVRAVWAEKMGQGNKIKLKGKVDDQYLYEALDDVEQKDLKEAPRKKAVRAVMDKYIEVI